MNVRSCVYLLCAARKTKQPRTAIRCLPPVGKQTALEQVGSSNLILSLRHLIKYGFLVYALNGGFSVNRVMVNVRCICCVCLPSLCSWSYFFSRLDTVSACSIRARFPSRQAQNVMDSIKGKYNRPIATECKDATVYWPAEVWLSSFFFFSRFLLVNRCVILGKTRQDKTRQDPWNFLHK